MYGDVARLDRALSNLVDNAFRHGGGHIDIDIRATSGGAVLTVTDEGAGFPTDETNDPGGNGLGLTIVREIVLAHSGTIDVHRVDHRTHVRVTIPTSQP